MALDTQALGIPRRTVRQCMTQVMLALLPGTLIYGLLIDSRLFVNIIVAGLFALCCEALCLQLRQRVKTTALTDGSVLLASWLLVLCLPPSLPFWQLFIGVALMVTLGKHLFGGLGHNPFNPAMVAYAVLLVSFPVTMTDWKLGDHVLVDYQVFNNDERELALTPSLGNQVSTSWDGLTGATVLDRLREVKQLSADKTPASNASALSETSAQANNRYDSSPLILKTPWVWVNLAWLAGGLYLLWIRVISWHIPATVLISITSLYTVAALLSSESSLQVIPALLSGAIMLGAFFIATDPISGAASRQGQLLYGAGIGVITFVIREYSVYPEGIAFAVLMMNMCVPLIDRISTGPKGRLTLRKHQP